MARTRSKATRTKNVKRSAPGPSKRAQVVWASLVLSMTGVGGVLFALSGKPVAGGDGLALPPLMATTTPDTLEVVLTPRVPLKADRWQYIVIHDSGSPVGEIERMDADARSRGLTKGLGYHFVIGNGNGLDDGELYIGSRWLQQDFGAHTAGRSGDQYNRAGIGICLVGDGDRRGFSREQMRRLVQLVSTLQAELGIPADRVYLHSQLAPTSSPGRFFSEAAFRSQLAR